MNNFITDEDSLIPFSPNLGLRRNYPNRPVCPTETRRWRIGREVMEEGK
jgi:hypothetical protein